MIRKLVLALQRLRQEERGVAAVEFALIFPLLITLYLGSIEAAALYTVDKRVSSVSSAIGDLVAQWDPRVGTISTGTSGTMADYMNASLGIMAPYATTGMKIIVSLVQVKNDGTTKVLWSSANAAATARTAGTAFTDLGASSQMNSVSRGGCVIAAEVRFAYVPVLGKVFTTALNINHTNYFLPRYGSATPIKLDTTTSLASDACTKQT